MADRPTDKPTHRDTSAIGQKYNTYNIMGGQEEGEEEAELDPFMQIRMG